MTPTFDADLDARAFDALFEQVITPAVSTHEVERRRLVARFWRWIAIAAAVGGVAAGVIMAMTHDDDAQMIPLFAIIVAAVFGYLPLTRFQARCKAIILADLGRSLGLTYRGEGFEPPAFQRVRALGLVPSHDAATFEDLFSGERQGCPFDLYEARLTEEDDDHKTRTRFRGQIARVRFPKSFLGVTVVAREGASFRPPKGLKRVGLESSEFERAFEVSGSDQVEARYLVHPAFMARLIDLEKAAAGQRIRCAFEDGDLLIAMEGGDLFEVANAFRPLPDRDGVRKGLQELDAVLKLIGAVLDPPRPQYGAAS